MVDFSTQCIREDADEPRLERALEMLYSHRGHPRVELDRLLVDDPRNLAAHCLRAALIVQAISSR